MAKNNPSRNSILDMFSKFGSDMKLPKIDVEAVLGHHRKNLEALEKSARAAAAGASSVAAKQREALQQTLSEIAEMARRLLPAANAQDFMSRQAEFARKSFRGGGQERRRSLRKSCGNPAREAVEILRERIEEAMKEVRSGVEDRKGGTLTGARSAAPFARRLRGTRFRSSPSCDGLRIRSSGR